MVDIVSVRKGRHRVKRLAKRKAQYAWKRAGRSEVDGKATESPAKFTKRPRK